VRSLAADPAPAYPQRRSRITVTTTTTGLASMRYRHFIPVCCLLPLLASATSCLPTTERDLQMAQLINEMSDAVNDIKNQQMYMQDQLDSLVMVSAKQDSLIRQLANLAGVAVPP
jgi:hypothetical protein